MNSISVKGHASELLIRIEGYEHPSSSSGPDANWLSTAIRLNLPGIRATHRLALTTYDLDHFKQELDASLTSFSGVASLTTDEGCLSVKITFQATGKAEVEGNIKFIESFRASLNFSFESDQSFLSPFAKDLEAVLQRFPVRR